LRPRAHAVLARPSVDSEARGVIGHLLEELDNCTKQLDEWQRGEHIASREPPAARVAEIAKRAVSGGWPEGQIEFEISELLEIEDSTLRALYGAEQVLARHWQRRGEEAEAEVSTLRAERDTLKMENERLLGLLGTAAGEDSQEPAPGRENEL